jgi:alpha-tubulin suppressor-like RCC1 family protein
MSVKRYSAQTDSKLKTCAADFLLRMLAVILLFAMSSGSLTGCDSQATVQWENKQRSEMKERIGSIFNDPALADFYKDLTSNLTENERQLVNAILQLVIDRNPSGADKNATVNAIFKAVASFRNEESIRKQLPDALAAMQQIAKNTDTSLQRLAEGTAFAPTENRLEYLKRGSILAEYLIKNESFNKAIEAKIPKVAAENIPNTLSLWAAFEGDSRRDAVLTTLLGIASVTPSTDFGLLVARLTASSSRDNYIASISKIKTDDSNSTLFIKLLNKLEIESLKYVDTILSEYGKAETTANVRASIIDAVKKGLTLNNPIAGAYASTVKDFLSNPNLFVRLSSLSSSVDALRGEGFYSGVVFQNRYVTDQEALICSLQGDSSENVTYSFKWNKNGALLIDWTTPGSARTHTSQTFALGEQPQCFVRVYINKIQTLELEGELVTVMSSPPEFNSGRIPSIAAESISQGTTLYYTAENATDANIGDQINYRLTAQASHGSVFQTGLNQFEYRPIVSFVGSDEFRYKACDQTGMCSNEKTVIVTVTEANLPPIIHGVAGIGVNPATKTIMLAEDVSADSSAVPVIQLVAEDDDTEPVSCSTVLQINSLDITKLLDAPSKIQISGTFPQCTFKLLPELNQFGSFKIKAKLTDAENSFTEKEIDVFITNVNDSPSITAIAAQTTTEDTSSAPIPLTVNDSDGPVGSCSGSSISYSSAATSIVAASGALTFGGTWPNCTIAISPVSNAVGTSVITVTASDGTLSGSQSFPLTVSAVNDAPNLTGSATSSYSEGGSAIVIDSTITINDGDDTNLESATVIISAGFTAGDELNFINDLGITGNYIPANGTLTLTGSSSIANYTTALRSVKFDSTSDNPTASSPSRTITWRVNDGDLVSSAQSSTVNITAVNDAPTVTPLASLTYLENGAPAAIDNAISITDTDGSTLTGATISISGGFAAGDVLGVADPHGTTVSFDATTFVLSLTGSRPLADYQNALRSVTFSSSSENPTASRTISWVVNDGGLISTAVTSTITITPSNDAPVITAIGNLIYNENAAAAVLDAGIIVSDIDSSDLSQATVRISSGLVSGDTLAVGTPNGTSAIYDAATGVLTVSGSGIDIASWQSALRSITFTSSVDNPTTSRIVSWSVTDASSTTSAVAYSSITLLPANDAPTLVAGGTVTFTENSADVNIDSGINVTDPDSNNVAFANVSISSGFVSGDLLGFIDQNGINGSYNATTGLLTLTGSRPLADYLAALGSVTFSSNVDNPTTSRTISWLVNDGDLNSAAATSTITFVAINDAPVITAGGSMTYVENAAAGVLNAGIIVSDVDSPNLSQATVTISSGYVTGDALEFLTQNGISEASNIGGVLTLTGAATAAHYQAALRSVKFSSSVNNPATSRTITWSVSDASSAASAAATSAITITLVNDAPTISAGGSATFTENSGAVAIDNGITIVDLNSTVLSAATVSIHDGFVSGDSLGFVNQDSISGSYNSITGVLSLTGNSSLANYETALKSVTFSSSVENPTTSRTIRWTVTDNSSETSTYASSSISIVPINDAPTISTVGSVTFSENSTPVAIDTGLTVADLDNTNLSYATITLSSGFVSGDSLNFSDQNGIKGSYSATTGVLTLAGNSSLANYQTALRSVTFSSNTENPTASRTVSWVVNDGGLNSTAVTSSITITPANDAPVITAGGNLIYNENAATAVLDAGIILSDIDSVNLFQATVTISAGFVSGDTLAVGTPNGTSASYDSATGVLTVSGSGISVAAWQTALRSVTFTSTVDNPTASRTVTWTVTDSSSAPSVAATSSITIIPINDAPTGTAGGTLAYTENGTAEAIDNTVTPADIDSTTLSSATITISSGFVSGDSLGFSTQNGITGSFTSNATTGVLTLTGTASLAHYQTALRSVTFSSSSENPTTSRTISWVVNDGGLNSTAVTSTITITPANDAPVITAGGNLIYMENAAAAVLDGGIILSDIDSANLSLATVTISSGFVTGDTLAVGTLNGTSASYDSATGVLTVSGSGIGVAAWQNALRSVTFTSTVDNPTASRTLSWIVSDASSTASATANSSITILPVNDAPTITAGGSATFTENSSAVAIDTALTIADTDSTTLSSAAVTISSGFVSSDVLGFSNQNGITGSFTSNATTGVLTLTGIASLAHYQTALRSVTFSSNADVPTSGRIISWVVNDGGLNSAAATSTISITPANDAPVITAGGSLTYIENAAAAAIDGGINVTDIDSVNLSQATVTVSAGFVSGDTLAVGTPNGTSSSYNATTGVLTVSGSGVSVSAWQSALRSVTFVSSVENPTASRTITWTVTDSSSAQSVAATSSITIVPVNDAPTMNAGGGATYTENSGAISIDSGLTVTDIDSTNFSSATVTISSGFVSGDSLGFSTQNGISGSYTYNASTGALTLTGNASLADYQTALRTVTFSTNVDNPTATRTISWIVSDGALNSVAVTSTISITPANDAPVLTAGGSLTYIENAAASAIDAGINVSDIDSVNLSQASVTISSGFVTGDTLAVGSANGTSSSYNATTGVLTVSGSGIAVAAWQSALRSVTFASSVDNPTASRTISWTVTDASSAQSVAVTSAITIIPVNDAPTITAGGAFSYTENGSAAAIDITITASDADSTNLSSAAVTISSGFVSGDTLGFSTQNGISGSYNATTGVLSLTGTSLVADYQTALRSVTFSSTVDNPTASRTISWIVSDGALNSAAVTSTISITPANDAPVLTAGGSLTYIENAAASILDAGINISDIDSVNLSQATVTISSGFVNGDNLAVGSANGTSSSYNATTGVLTVSGSGIGVAAWQSALRSVTFASSVDNPTASRTISWTVTDASSSQSVAATSAITIIPVNDAPTGTAGGTLSYTENGSAAVIDITIAITDIDSTNISSATVTISSGFVSGDSLGFSTQNGITGAYNATTGVLSLSGTSSLANYQTALRSVTFSSSVDNSTNRTISWVVNDGGLNSTAATSTVTITPANDAPVLTAGGSLTYIENAAAAAIDSGINVSDIDSANLSLATVTISSGFVSGDTLAVGAANGTSSSYNATTGVLTVSGSGIGVAAWQSALRSITFASSADNPTTSRTISWIVSDSSSTQSAGANSSITILPINDAPTITAGGSATFTENSSAVAIDTGLSVADIDSTDFSSATVTISSGFVSGDSLGFSTQNGISGSYNATTGVLSLTGTSLIANYQTAIRSVTFSSSVDNPTASRTISWIVSDDALNSSAATSTVSINPANDAPVLTAGGSLAYIENATAAVIDAGINISDIDSVNLSQASVTISAGFVSGDTLAVGTPNGTSSSYNGTTGVLTVSGSGISVAAWQSALRSVTFSSSVDNPTASRTISWLVSDASSAQSVAATSAITIIPVNDAPTGTAGGSLSYTENGTAAAIDIIIAIADVDSTNLSSATVSISSGFVSGDSLGFINQNGISGSYNATTGVLSLTGTSLLADYQTALRSVTFSSNAENPTASRTISWVVSDGALNSSAVTSTVSITPQNDAPLLTAGGILTYIENGAASVIDAGINVSDIDSVNLSQATVTISSGFVSGDTLAVGAANGTSSSYNSTTGVLTVSGSGIGVAAWQSALRSVTFASSVENPTASRTITWIVSDVSSAQSAGANSSITIVPVNDGPTGTAGGSLSYTENGSASAIDITLAISDVDSTNLSSATVTVSSGFVSGDSLGFSTQNGITGAYNATTGVLTLTGSSLIANYQTALRSVTFSSNTDNPTTSRTISWVVSDGALSSAATTSTITITPVNDAPLITAGNTLAYSENGVALSIATALTLSDADNTTQNSATVTITTVSNGDILGFTDQNGITGSFNSGTGVLSLTGSASLANYQSALRSVTFRSTSDNPTTTSASRSISWLVNDGSVSSAAATSTINITAGDDSPQLAAGGNLAYTENSAATAIDAGITVADLDTNNLSSATVTISNGFVSGDSLGFSTQNGITGAYNATTGVLTLTGSSLTANYQAALRSVTFSTNVENPATSRAVSWVVNDGGLNSTAATSTISITPLNDAPVMTAGGTFTYSEGASAAVIDATITASDADNSQMASATASITAGFTSDDILQFTAQLGIIGAFNSSTGVLLLSGAAPIADYVTALRSVTFRSTSDHPTATSGTRTISWQLYDGSSNSTAVTSSATITAVSDAPIVTASGTLSYSENASAAAINSAVIVTDADSENLSGATVTISNGYTTGDTLGFSNQNGISIASNTGGVLTLTGTATVAHYQSALRSVTFNSTSENPTATSVSRTMTWVVNDSGGLNSAAATSTILISPVNDAPASTPTCSTLSSGNIFRTGLALGGGWTLDSCSGATDIDGDALTYRLDLAETGSSSSAAYSCPTPISSSSGGTSVAGNFPNGVGVYGSCRYLLKACDPSGLCTSQSANSVIISSYQLAIGTPTTVTLSSSCVVGSSGTITPSANITSVSWSANTNSVGSVQATGTSSTFPATTTFNTNLTSTELLGTTLLPSTPTKTTTTSSAIATLSATQLSLTGAGANTTPSVTAVATGAGYTITRLLESLAVRQGGAAGAATSFADSHSDGLQVDYVTTASVCRSCTSNPTVSLSAGNGHTCVVQSASSTKCWGDNSDGGRLGDGSGTPALGMPTSIATTNLSGFTHNQIVSGSNFSCLLGSTTDGVRCWGKNNSLQLGRGSSTPSSSSSPPATSVSNLTNPIALAASKTGEHACAINTSGNARCWGKGTSGQLGNAAVPSVNSHTAVEVKLDDGTTSLPSVRSIAVGEAHTCATLSFNSANASVTEKGIYCWGLNNNGQLGDGTTTDKNTATSVTTTSQGVASSNTWFTQVVAGASHTCALRNDGAAYCWGLNDKGQLGNGNTTAKNIPIRVKADATNDLANVVALSAGANHTCALKADHSVVCWGANEDGQLGDNTTTNRSYPVAALSASASNALALSAGGSHTCVASLNGTVQCWGAGNSGQLGTNTFSASGDGAADDCDSEVGQTKYCSKSPVLVQWSAGTTSNATMRPKTCNKYSIP